MDDQRHRESSWLVFHQVTPLPTQSKADQEFLHPWGSALSKHRNSVTEAPVLGLLQKESAPSCWSYHVPCMSITQSTMPALEGREGEDGFCMVRGLRTTASADVPRRNGLVLHFVTMLGRAHGGLNRQELIQRAETEMSYQPLKSCTMTSFGFLPKGGDRAGWERWKLKI